jgi:Uma2 family endonuclease
MASPRPTLPQTDPPRPPREILPTMYDLPSEHPEEPGLPDEYHYLQPQLLSATLKLSQYSADQIFSVGDMNLYYDVRHPNRYKRPDWFAVAGVSRLYGGQDLRLSYVIWQEGVVPTVVVELLSPGTEKEDLGQTPVPASGIPTKWQVYEQILRVPYYVVFDRYQNHLQAFQLVGDRYQPMETSQQRFSSPLGSGNWWCGRAIMGAARDRGCAGPMPRVS